MICQSSSSTPFVNGGGRAFGAPASPGALLKSTPAAQREQPVYAYIVTTIKTTPDFQLCQTGSGPNFDGGRITLCTCKHKDRATRGLDKRAYGNSKGRAGSAFSEYFPTRHQEDAKLQAMHVDPEFESFTYGDPTPPKRGLAKMQPGDLLVFYAGMEGWGHHSAPHFISLVCFAWSWRAFRPASRANNAKGNSGRITTSVTPPCSQSSEKGWC